MERYSNIVYTNCAYSASIDIIAIVESMAKNTISRLTVEVAPDRIIMSDDRPIPEQTKKIMKAFLNNLLGQKNYIVKFDERENDSEGVKYTRYIFNR